MKLIGLLLMVTRLTWGESTINLQSYLQQVREQNPQAVAETQMVKAYEQRIDQGLGSTVPIAYVNYHLLDDRKPNQNVQFMGDRTKSALWKVGVRDQTKYGLTADMYVDSADNRVWGASSNFLPLNPYRDTRAVLELKQSLWRNGFGEQTKNEIHAARSAVQSQLAQAQFNLRQIIVEAENTYWALASYNEITKLQLENVERARKLRDYMKQRTKMRLFDDVDFMQAQASFESRELEYQTSLDERATVVRAFNTMRGMNSNKVEDLEALPTQDWRKEVNTKLKLHRGDFLALKSLAEAKHSTAVAARSGLRPVLDLVASVATTGRDTTFSDSVSRAQDFDHPTYSVGVNFSVGIDFRLLRDLRASYEMEQKAALSQVQAAEFSEGREWQGAVDRKREAVGRFDRAVSLEKLYGEIVRRERQRLSNGRTTTFQFLKFEQDFAGVQVQRVRSQLALLQLHNALKLFEE